MKKRIRIMKKILCFSIQILLVFLVTFLIVNFVARKIQVVGSSMEPAFHDSDQLIAEKISLYRGNLKRFDVIVFPYAYDSNKHLIKRIIALPGERIRIDNTGLIYINGQVLKENYGKEPIKDPGLAEKELLCGENEFFVLGDNRNDSVDSRSTEVFMIPGSRIDGKVLLRLWPIDKMGFIH